MSDEHYTKRIEKLLSHHIERMEKIMALQTQALTDAVTNAIASIAGDAVADAALKAENDQLKADVVKDQATIDDLTAKLKAAMPVAPPAA